MSSFLTECLDRMEAAPKNALSAFYNIFQEQMSLFAARARPAALRTPIFFELFPFLRLCGLLLSSRPTKKKTTTVGPYEVFGCYTMENILTIKSGTGGCDDTLDIDALFRDQLVPLLQKFKYRLSQFEQSINDDSKRLQDYSSAKIKRAYEVLEALDKEWHNRWQSCSFADKQHGLFPAFLTQTLQQSLTDLSEKYKELESTLVGSDDYFEKTLDDTIDALMSKIEEVDGRISDAIDRAAEMRHKVHEKIHKVAGRASEQMDQLKQAVAHGAKRLLSYEELPEQWRNNKVNKPLTRDEFSACLLTKCYYSTSTRVTVSFPRLPNVGTLYYTCTTRPETFTLTLSVSSSSFQSAFTSYFFLHRYLKLPPSIVSFLPCSFARLANV